MRRSSFLMAVAAIWLSGGFVTVRAAPHEHSQKKAEQRQRQVEQQAAALAEQPANARQPRCRLVVRLRDQAGKPYPAGLVRITNSESGKAVSLPEGIHRELNWFSVAAATAVTVPQSKIRIEAIYGIESELGMLDADLTGRTEKEVDIVLPRLDAPANRGLRSGNTHLHLMKMSYLDALRYLEVVPQSDGLDLVFLSHLRRVPDDREYTSNRIVENSFSGGDLQRLSQHGALFGIGEEHRHNFGRGGEGYGHVMLLDLMRLIEPVSIGPGIMENGTDGLPLRKGIQEARGLGATVIWCHNSLGLEDVPNWMSGLLHAQNIHDGGEHGSYEDTYYRYLNLGMHVPFSTGTDWFIYDFSRAYVPVTDQLTSEKWLAALREGKSYITNGPLLEFTVNDRPPGDTLSQPGGSELRIRGRAICRSDFRAIELIHNGEIIRTVESRAEAKKKHFVAELQTTVAVDQPGWFALRIPLKAGKNELEKDLFAHTSPVYFEPEGKKIFRPQIARDLIREVESNVIRIQELGKFANDAERESVLKVHREGVRLLRERLGEE